MPGPEWFWIAAGLLFPPVLCGIVFAFVLGRPGEVPAPKPTGDARLIAHDIRARVWEIQRKRRLGPTPTREITPTEIERLR